MIKEGMLARSASNCSAAVGNSCEPSELLLKTPYVANAGRSIFMLVRSLTSRGMPVRERCLTMHEPQQGKTL